MPSVQQIKHVVLGSLIVFVIFSQTALQIHLSYRSKDDSSNADKSSSSESLLSNLPDVNRLKRSLSRHKIVDDNEDNSLTATLVKPTGSVPPPLSLTTAKAGRIPLSSLVFTPPSSSLPSSPSSQLPLKLSPSPSPEDPAGTGFITDWSAVPEHLFIRNYYTGNFSNPNPDLCNKKQNLTLLILVTSAIDHFAQRNAVRQTWGHFGLRADVQFAFVIGDSLLHRYNESVRAAFQDEINLYDDFVIGSFEDTYRNLTIKTLHMLDWISTYCHTAEYFLKTDDDVFLNVLEILRHIDSVKAEDQIQPKIYGHVFYGHFPKRDMIHRHSVGFDVYPSTTLGYPNFTSGPAYLMSIRIVRPLFDEVLKLPFIPLEDVLTTGFAAMNLGIPRVDLPGFHNEMKNPVDFTACELITIFAGMTDGSPVQMNYVWFNYVMGRTLCTWKYSTVTTTTENSNNLDSNIDNDSNR